MGIIAEITSSVLLFGLVYGMSATVQLSQLFVQVRNCRALLVGCCMQFIILPFIGFCCIHLFNLPAPVGITLMVVTSSPGGSYSNWWCSVFNAELALSVTMTAISTLLSTIMLPFNLLLYSKWTYSARVVQNLDWNALFVSICVVIGGITCGLITSAYGQRTGNSIEYHRKANRLGNICGIALICLSIIVSIVADHNDRDDDNNRATIAGSSSSSVAIKRNGAVWNQPWNFYVGCGLPVILGLCIVTYITTKLVHLENKPERVATAIESCYQNTGIATSVALTMFSSTSTTTTASSYSNQQQFMNNMTNSTYDNNGTLSDLIDYYNQTQTLTPTTYNDDNSSSSNNDLALALGVPLFYGIVEAISLAIYCLVCWKLSWTKAPANENLCVILTTTYEVSSSSLEHECQGDSQDQQQNSIDINDDECMSSVEMNNRKRKDDDDNNDNNGSTGNGHLSSSQHNSSNGLNNHNDSEISTSQQQQATTSQQQQQSSASSSSSPIPRRPIHKIVAQQRFDDNDNDDDNNELDIEEQIQNAKVNDVKGMQQNMTRKNKNKYGLFRLSSNNSCNSSGSGGSSTNGNITLTTTANVDDDDDDDDESAKNVCVLYSGENITPPKKFSPMHIGKRFSRCIRTTTNDNFDDDNDDDDDTNGPVSIILKDDKQIDNNIYNDDNVSETESATTSLEDEIDTEQQEQQEQDQLGKNRNSNNNNKKHRIRNTISRVRARAAGYKAATTISPTSEGNCTLTSDEFHSTTTCR